MYWKVLRLSVAASSLAATLGIAAAPAMAHVGFWGTAGAGQHVSSVLRPGPLNASGFATNPYIGGYVVSPSEGVASIGSTFKVPNPITCSNSSDYEDVFLGQVLTPASGDGYQGGSNDAGADVIAYCSGNGVMNLTIEAYTANGGDNYGLPVNPGDKIITRIALTNTGQTVATATDVTTGGQETASGATVSGDTQFYQGVIPNVSYEQLSSGTLNIPKFHNVTFSNSMPNGQYLSQTNPTGYKLDQDGPVQIVPSKFPAPPAVANGFTDTELSTS